MAKVKPFMNKKTFYKEKGATKVAPFFARLLALRVFPTK